MKKPKQKLKSNYPFYVVFTGSKIGIFESFHKAKQSYEGYPYGRCKSYYTLKEAEDAFNRCPNALQDSNKEHNWSFTPPPRGNNC